MYRTKLQLDKDSWNYRTKMTITDDTGEREYYDGGEPEDNSFGRDWSWVTTELQKAYEQGLVDGRKEC